MRPISGSRTGPHCIGSATSPLVAPRPLASLGRPTLQGRPHRDPWRPLGTQSTLARPIWPMAPEGLSGARMGPERPQQGGMGPTRQCDSFMGPNTLEETSTRYARWREGLLAIVEVAH